MLLFGNETVPRFVLIPAMMEGYYLADVEALIQLRSNVPPTASAPIGLKNIPVTFVPAPAAVLLRLQNGIRRNQ